jgi:hypothetical protein
VLPALALVLGAVLGFAGSRRLRRPDRAAQAASVARAVSGSLGGRRTLSAPELQRACLSEMVRHVRVGRNGSAEAPATYVIRLNPTDHAVVEENRGWFTGGLTDALTRAAQEQGWKLEGPVSITFEADPSRHLGVPSALAIVPDAPAGTEPEPAPPPPSTGSQPVADAARSTLVVVRTDTGEQLDLGAEAITIGRSRDRTITVDDNRVSRSHARIERSGSGWAVIDEGSSNGTRVGGTELTAGRPRILRPGDVVSVGPLDLRVAAKAGGPAPEVGTQAVDDRTRTRISAEILPPGREGPG